MTWYGNTLRLPDVLGVHLTKCQHDQKPDQMSTWPKAWSIGIGGTCDVYYFYTHLKLWRLISLFILLFFLHIFLFGNAWNRLWVKWHGMADEPHPRGKEFHWNAPKHIFEVHFILNSPPPNFFQHSHCFRDWDPSEIYISISFLYKCETFRGIYFSSYWYFFTYFLSGNFWGGCFTC